ncbi:MULTISPECIES: alpha/beta fold hydrolase [unclassified Leifsonia]|uniref:alpha/beta fold hydrolase n=1 Tax=unclassified Leifsonia TaxID=2663824 RepID=UPI0006FACEB3|nr:MULTISPECIES: alpha/beta hydrolase [unclassified Leifsonia]KQX08556.1 hydrolase [Leifsonia sp. Root1293]KRA12842.1 hydrolase [Leifsonia sp. Root60]
MQHATSADGTPIAFNTTGDGPPVLIVGGAFSTAEAGEPLAAALASAGYQGVTVDRRARGDSGDTTPYAPEREAEDLAAVISAVGGEASVLGHSSGAVLALFAAGQGVPIRHLFLSEPPFHFGEGEPADDLPDRLQTLVIDGRPEDAVTLFQLEGIGLAEPMVEQIKASPMFATLVPLAQSTVYDAILTAAVSTPTDAMTSVSAPVTVLRGEPTFPMLVRAAGLLAEAIPDAELVVVPESRDHRPDPDGTAREIALRLGKR